MWNRADPDFLPYEVISNLNDVGEFPFKENGFNFAFALFDMGAQKYTDVKPEFGKF